MADLRRCIGSAKFGIEAHEAPQEEFPNQPSQKDGLGRMCKVHWNEYTTALRKAATTGKANATAVDSDTPVGVMRAAAAAERAKERDAAKVQRARAKAPVAKKPEPIRTKAPHQPR